MRICDNYEAKIWLGLREGYTSNYYSDAHVSQVISRWCTEKKQCVSITPTQFVYVKTDETGEGTEHGVIIGFINYPRYPLSEAEIKNRARELGELLMKEFKQYRVSITFYPSMPGGTMMLENDELEEK
jgi:hypothetical protein